MIACLCCLLVASLGVSCLLCCDAWLYATHTLAAATRNEHLSCQSHNEATTNRLSSSHPTSHILTGLDQLGRLVARLCDSLSFPPPSIMASTSAPLAADPKHKGTLACVVLKAVSGTVLEQIDASPDTESRSRSSLPIEKSPQQAIHRKARPLCRPVHRH